MKRYKTVQECALDLIKKHGKELTNKQLAEEVRKIMTSETTDKCIAWYKNRLKSGLLQVPEEAEQKETFAKEKLLLTKRFDDAVLWAINCHSRQTRKGTDIPYISHLMGVASIVMEHTTDEDVVIAALLHDAAEDQGGKEMLDKIRFVFGDKVAEIVEGCTDAWVIPKPSWLERKQKYIDSLPRHSEETHLVSIGDKLHNVRSILYDYRSVGEDVWLRFTGGKEGTLWYYRELVKAFLAIANPKHKHLVVELDDIVTKLEGAVKVI